MGRSILDDAGLYAANPKHELKPGTRQDVLPQLEVSEDFDWPEGSDAEAYWDQPARLRLLDLGAFDRMLLSNIVISRRTLEQWCQAEGHAFPSFWVEVAEVSAPGTAEGEHANRAPTQAATCGYSIDDKPLLREMADLLDRRESVSAWAAAQAVADKARGPGTPESKAKRLHRRFQSFQSRIA